MRFEAQGEVNRNPRDGRQEPASLPELDSSPNCNVCRAALCTRQRHSASAAHLILIGKNKPQYQAAQHDVTETSEVG
jgi:hypothetical protein